MKQWEDFTYDYDYEKTFYDVLLPDGDIVSHCWPNAGKMMATDNTGRGWTGACGVKVKKSTTCLFETLQEKEKK